MVPRHAQEAVGGLQVENCLCFMCSRTVTNLDSVRIIGLNMLLTSINLFAL